MTVETLGKPLVSEPILKLIQCGNEFLVLTQSGKTLRLGSSSEDRVLSASPVAQAASGEVRAKRKYAKRKSAQASDATKTPEPVEEHQINGIETAGSVHMNP